MSRRNSLMLLALLLVIAFTVTAVAAYAKDAPVYTKGQKIQVEWKGKWYPSTILEIGTAANIGKYKIHYDGWGSEWDEWVGPNRMKAN